MTLSCGKAQHHVIVSLPSTFLSLFLYSPPLPRRKCSFFICHLHLLIFAFLSLRCRPRRGQTSVASGGFFVHSILFTKFVWRRKQKTSLNLRNHRETSFRASSPAPSRPCCDAAAAHWWAEFSYGDPAFSPGRKSAVRN